ncbi:MAG: glutathione S-transferase N-terminal domain-containing protein [Nannocystaceae bacterium]|nr:glutathione S-transferase N-terminal domain-containing protein [Nannocystaceae bacterium]
MKLYFSPLSCSLASRIVVYERGLDVEFSQVDRLTKALAAGGDLRDINTLGLVPTLQTDEGSVVAENAAVLQYLWRLPVDGEVGACEDLVGMQRWLSFVATELHKLAFYASFDAKSPPEAKAYGLGKGRERLRWLDQTLGERPYLTDAFGPQDAYLYTVLNWTPAVAIELSDYPNLERYYRGLSERPSVRKAVAVERPLYEAARG